MPPGWKPYLWALTAIVAAVAERHGARLHIDASAALGGARIAVCFAPAAGAA